MDIVEKIRTRFQKDGIMFDEDTNEDGVTFFRLRQKTESEYLIILISFNNDYSACDITIGNIVRIESPLKREELLKLLNEFNGKYRYQKYFVEDNGDVLVQYSLPVTDSTEGEDVERVLIIILGGIIKDNLPKFMKLRWS